MEAFPRKSFPNVELLLTVSCTPFSRNRSIGLARARVVTHTQENRVESRCQNCCYHTRNIQEETPLDSWNCPCIPCSKQRVLTRGSTVRVTSRQSLPLSRTTRRNDYQFIKNPSYQSLAAATCLPTNPPTSPIVLCMAPAVVHFDANRNSLCVSKGPGQECLYGTKRWHKPKTPRPQVSTTAVKIPGKRAANRAQVLQATEAYIQEMAGISSFKRLVLFGIV